VDFNANTATCFFFCGGSCLGCSEHCSLSPQ
jgi:hypothetical protein